MLFGHHAPAREPEGILQQDADGEGEPVEPGGALAFELRQSVNGGGVFAEGQLAAGAEGVG